MKNTMGYGLNAFLDHRRPADDPRSPGCRRQRGHARLRRRGDLPHGTGAAARRDRPARLRRPCAQAMAAMPALVGAGPAAVELLDAAALRVAQARPAGRRRAARPAGRRDHAALLVEWQEPDPEALADGSPPTARGCSPTCRWPARAAHRRGAGRAAALWHIRKGLYAAVAGARPSGTTALLEDIAVRSGARRHVRRAHRRCSTGTATPAASSSGTPRTATCTSCSPSGSGRASRPDRYAAFTEDMVDAGPRPRRHAQGRARHRAGDGAVSSAASTATNCTRSCARSRRCCDPAGVLNPGVLLSDDPDTHLRHLKTVPTVEPEVDRCVECGYCEPVCPSRDLTTTPRQRIVLRREIAAGRGRRRHRPRRGAGGRLRLRRGRHLRRRRHVRHRLPRAHQHRRPGEAAARRRSGGPRRRPAGGPRHAHWGARHPGRGPRRWTWPARCRPRCPRAATGAARAVLGAGRLPAVAPRPARGAAGRAGRPGRRRRTRCYVAVLPGHDVRARRRRRRRHRRAAHTSPSGPASGCSCPSRRRRPVLRHAVVVQGPPPARRDAMTAVLPALRAASRERRAAGGHATPPSCTEGFAAGCSGPAAEPTARCADRRRGGVRRDRSCCPG